MSDSSVIGFRSPHLTGYQETSLDLVEEGLTEGDDAKISQGMRGFLESGFQLVHGVIRASGRNLDRVTLEAIGAEKIDGSAPLRELLWHDETLTPFSERLLLWADGELSDELALLTLDELNACLRQSASFLASLEPEEGLAPVLPVPQETETADEPSDLFPENAEDEEEAKVEEAPEMLAPSTPPPIVQARVAPVEVAVPQDERGELMEMSHSPLSPLEKNRQLVVKKKFLGYGKNSDGVLGYCGQLTLSRFDDGKLSVRLETSNPLLFLNPSNLAGVSSGTITYWMPPVAFPQPSGHLTIVTPDHSKIVSIGGLFPQSRTDFMKGRQVLALLFAPSVLGLLYFAFVYVLSTNGVVSQVRALFPEEVAVALSGSAITSFRDQGVGLYQLEVVPAAESLQLIWATLIWLCPLLATKFFRHLSRTRQRDLGGALAASLLLPSVGLLLMWNGQKKLFPLVAHPDFAPLDLRYFLPWSFPLNVAIAGYLFLSVHGFWDRRVRSKELRLLLPLALFAAYLLLMFVLIFGRSWFD